MLTSSFDKHSHPKAFFLSLGFVALSLSPSFGGLILVDFAGGSTTGTAVSNTNSLTGNNLDITAGSVVDLDGNVVSGLSISSSGSSSSGVNGIHVNGAGAVLNAATISSNASIDSAFGSYENAYSSSWGPENGGVGNSYTVVLGGLSEGIYTVKLVGGRDGGIAWPNPMSLSWTRTDGDVTLDTEKTSYVVSDGNSVSLSGSGDTYSFDDLQTVFNIGDAGMSTWTFVVGPSGGEVSLSSVGPINAMTISAIPEPSSILLLALGGLALVLRRRKYGQELLR